MVKFSVARAVSVRVFSVLAWFDNIADPNALTDSVRIPTSQNSGDEMSIRACCPHFPEKLTACSAVRIAGFITVFAIVFAQTDYSFAQDKKSGDEDKKQKSSKADVEKTVEVENPFPDRPNAPSLAGGTAWLNTSGEITMRDLRGKIVIFDFWTYCCINCMHVLPDLKFLERKYPNELVVIGVHSPKFDEEHETESIRQAIMRYEIEHPVVNDANKILSRNFRMSSWPTLVLVDPEGKYCGQISGEGHRDFFDQLIGKLIAYHKAKGTLDETPVRFKLERERREPTPLKYPGKILADESGNRLFISDSNHNRIVITTLDGQLLDVIGNGKFAANDGNYSEASFDRPQGMELVGDTLYVADTENHLLRSVNLKSKTVSTLAGTGKQARFRRSRGKLREMALNSPWAIEHVDGTLFIAMAGPHQIWSHDLKSQTIQVFSGSGHEDIIDGAHDEAALAQPSGIISDGNFLYIADSEGSSIRKISVKPDGRVSTVIGTAHLRNGRLFSFGDRDGVGTEAQLQHPLGVALHEGVLYVADSYNQKIKKINLKTRECTSWLGTGKRGTKLDPAEFSEPEGVSIAAGKLYIADTNNHRICVADLKTGQVVALRIDGLKPPKPDYPVVTDPDSGKKVNEVAPQVVLASSDLTFRLTFNLPDGFKLNSLASVRFKITAAGDQELIAAEHLDKRQKATSDESSATFSVPLAKKSGKAVLQVAVSYSYCRAGVGGVCKFKTERWKIPVELAADSKRKSISLTSKAK